MRIHRRGQVSPRVAPRSESIERVSRIASSRALPVLPKLHYTGPPTTIPRPAAYCPRPPSQPTLSLDSLSHTLRPTPTVSTIPSPRHHLSSAWSTRPQTTTRTADTKDHPNAKSTARAYVQCCPSHSLRARDTSCTCPPSLPLLKNTRSMHFSHAVQGRLRPGSTRVVPSSQLFCTSSLWRCRHTQE